ncbi:MAG: DUF1080 domain-containing protein [Fimbriimonadaceae bacterium]|nr:DUF1080 domain-containing protein [Fimbriimonadaceae bacterium]
MVRRTRPIFALGLLLIGTSGLQAGNAKAQWVDLFDGKTLEGWTPKIKGAPLGNNVGNVFRVRNGAIVVDYSEFGDFNARFGHLFHRTPQSRYRLQMEYRFVGKQATGGPEWATRNSGVMLHGQPADTMTLDQDFPASLEVQFLGTDGKSDRTTGNLCTPGTHVEIDGKLVTQHCINSTGKAYRDEEWVKAEIEVDAEREIVHRINGQVVMRYARPVYDTGDADGKRFADRFGTAIRGGTISLQSESHPVEFRRIRIQPLAD